MADFRRYFTVASLGVLFCVWCEALETNTWHSPAVISASHRFVASGMTSSENVGLAAAAEDVAGKIEDITRLTIPFNKGEFLQMFARRSTNELNGRVVKAQGWVDQAIAQKLIIVNPERADQEDVLEGLCWLLLNRYVIDRQTFEQKTSQLGCVPDWLSTGIAQNLFFALRCRNSQVVIQRWLKNEDLLLSEIVDLEQLPPGRWGEKAFCGLAVDWFTSRLEPAIVFERFFSCLAEGGEITTNIIGELLIGNESGRELEKGWNLWVASQTQVKRYWGGVTPERLESLRHLLAASPDEMGVFVGEDVPASLTIGDLMKYRNAPWLPLYAERLHLHIRGLGIGEAKEFSDVLALYGQYLDALARPRRGLNRWPLFRSSPHDLNRMLSIAEKRLADLEANLAQKNQYVIGARATVRDGIVVSASVSNTIADMQRFIPKMGVR